MSGGVALDAIRRCLLRELEALEREVLGYPTDAAAWVSIAGVPNTGATLALHCAGNLRHFVGAVLGGTGYVRDRSTEFAARDVTRTAIVAELRLAHRDVDTSLRNLSPDALDAPYPDAGDGGPMDTATMLVHLVAHLAYHLGQVDLHRRTVTGDTAGTDAVSRAALRAPGS